MRSLVFATALLMLLPAAFVLPATAEHGGSHGQGPPEGRPDNSTAGNGAAGNRTSPPGAACRDADDRRACMEAACEDDPDARGCQQMEACRGQDCAAVSPACLEGNRSACQELHELDDIRVQSRHVSFQVEQNGRQLLNYSIGGSVLVESVTYGRSNDSFDVDRHGSRIRFESESARLEIHDTPTGDFWFRGGTNDTIVLVLPDGASISEAPSGHLVDYGDRSARLAGAELAIAGQTVTASGHLTFFAPSGRGPAAASEALAEAKASQRVGAEISLRGQEADITAYDDVNITISMPERVAGNQTLRVRLDADLSEGRTFVLDVDPEQLGGAELELRYYDVHGENETEVVFREAGGLEDVLDPTDDGGQPEYWIVQDASGMHVMVSVPVWSVHIIELASVGEFLTQPSVLLGMAAGVVGVAVAGTAMFWPRRMEEEYVS